MAKIKSFDELVRIGDHITDIIDRLTREEILGKPMTTAEAQKYIDDNIVHVEIAKSRGYNPYDTVEYIEKMNRFEH